MAQSFQRVPRRSLKPIEFRAKADRERLDADAAPAADQIVAHLVDEDDDRQHEQERHDGADQQAVQAEYRRQGLDQESALKMSPDAAPACSVASMPANPWLVIGANRSVGRHRQPPTSPEAGLSALPNSTPITYRVKAAATSPSTRSMTPPWPGMMWLESLTPLRRLTNDSKRSPICDDDGEQQRDRRRPTGRPSRSAAASASPASSPPSAPPTAPLQVLPGEIDGASFGPPIDAADEIGQDVGRPDDREQEQDGDQAGMVAAAQIGEREAGQRGIGKPAGFPLRRLAQPGGNGWRPAPEPRPGSAAWSPAAQRSARPGRPASALRAESRTPPTAF